MQQAVIHEWAARLKALALQRQERQWKQGVGVLCRPANRQISALGVLCELATKSIKGVERRVVADPYEITFTSFGYPSRPSNRVVYTYCGEHRHLPRLVREWVGISWVQADRILVMNDAGHGFSAIAKHLEESWLKA